MRPERKAIQPPAVQACDFDPSELSRVKLSIRLGCCWSRLRLGLRIAGAPARLELRAFRVQEGGRAVGKTAVQAEDLPK
jgi:hypothetical protein